MLVRVAVPERSSSVRVVLVNAVPGPVDPELAGEQAYLDRSHEGLAAMRRRAEELLAELRAAGRPDLDHEAALTRRVGQLGDTGRPLLFGRIDLEGGEAWHIGRRHVEERDGDVLVVDWRAPVSTPFYRARSGDSLGLGRRRQIMVEKRQVIAIADDLFGSGADEDATRLRGGDALLAELERARTGEMLDIVATIQAEQHEVIRSPLGGTLVVQGGPGTGKTAVALHRAAYLLYNHPELARSGVLVLGPSRAFLRYIAAVLPSLGEEAVLQVTVADLVPRIRVAGTEADGVARVKGDARMAAVLARALGNRRRELVEPVTVRSRHVAVTIDPHEANEAVRRISERLSPYAAGRRALTARVVSGVVSRLVRAGRYEATEPWFARELQSSGEFTALRDHLWPRVSAAELVSGLLSSPPRLAEAAAGILSEDEMALLRRPRPARGSGSFTRFDVALLDEAHFLLSGPGRSYGHVIVDEAQDLSAMELRMVARRAPKGSVTVLGDLAQATSPAAQESWDTVATVLSADGEARREELTLGYRAPGQVLEMASRLLAVAAPGIRPTRSVRPGRFEPRVVTAEVSKLVPEALAEARRLHVAGFSVGVVFADATSAVAAHRAAGGDPSVGMLSRDGLGRPVTLLGATEAKGLEFDAVVVVEPSAFASGGQRGLRLLYVALTRPIQHLSIVHAEPLPQALSAGQLTSSGAS